MIVNSSVIDVHISVFICCDCCLLSLFSLLLFGVVVDDIAAACVIKFDIFK